METTMAMIDTPTCAVAFFRGEEFGEQSVRIYGERAHLARVYTAFTLLVARGRVASEAFRPFHYGWRASEAMALDAGSRS